MVPRPGSTKPRVVSRFMRMMTRSITLTRDKDELTEGDHSRSEISDGPSQGPLYGGQNELDPFSSRQPTWSRESTSLADRSHFSLAPSNSVVPRSEQPVETEEFDFDAELTAVLESGGDGEIQIDEPEDEDGNPAQVSPLHSFIGHYLERSSL